MRCRRSTSHRDGRTVAPSESLPIRHPIPTVVAAPDASRCGVSISRSERASSSPGAEHAPSEPRQIVGRREVPAARPPSAQVVLGSRRDRSLRHRVQRRARDRLRIGDVRHDRRESERAQHLLAHRDGEGNAQPPLDRRTDQVEAVARVAVSRARRRDERVVREQLRSRPSACRSAASRRTRRRDSAAPRRDVRRADGVSRRRAAAVRRHSAPPAHRARCFPAGSSRIRSVAVSSFDTLPIRNSVRGVAGVADATSALPTPCRQSIRSPSITVTANPGRCCAAAIESTNRPRGRRGLRIDRPSPSSARPPEAGTPARATRRTTAMSGLIGANARRRVSRRQVCVIPSDRNEVIPSERSESRDLHLGFTRRRGQLPSTQRTASVSSVAPGFSRGGRGVMR